MFLAKYTAFLASNPILTKSFTSAGISMVGDASSQVFLSDKPFDSKRCMKFGVLGFGLFGMPFHFWFGFLGRRFPLPQVKNKFSKDYITCVGKQIATDQFIWAPGFIFTVISTITILQDGKIEQKSIEKAIKNRYFETITTNWMVWVPAQAVNFALVPGQYQVLFVNVASLFWNTYLSYTAYKVKDA